MKPKRPKGLYLNLAALLARVRGETQARCSIIAVYSLGRPFAFARQALGDVLKRKSMRIRNSLRAL
jgi:hypothetical protein